MIAKAYICWMLMSHLDCLKVIDCSKTKIVRYIFSRKQQTVFITQMMILEYKRTSLMTLVKDNSQLVIRIMSFLALN